MRSTPDPAPVPPRQTPPGRRTARAVPAAMLAVGLIAAPAAARANAWHQAGQDIKQAAHETGRAIVTGAHAAGHAIRHTAHAIGGAIHRAVHGD